MSLTFNQKVTLGFAFILILLAASGMSSFWNLYDISRSNSRVNDTAVPIVREGNHLQIQLLKLANLGSVAFNAQQADNIKPYQADFDATAHQVAELTRQLDSISANDSGMKALVDGMAHNFGEYTKAMQGMFNAKLDALQAKHRTEQETEALLAALDNVLMGIAEIKFHEPDAQYAEDMQIVAGATDQAETYFAHMATEFLKIPRTQEADELQAAFAGAYDNIGYGMEQLEFANSVFRSFDTNGMMVKLFDDIDSLRHRMEASPNVVSHKEEQLALREQATEWFDQGTASVNRSVRELDTLLEAANAQFNRLQSDLSSTLDVGFKSTLAIMIVLFALATQNFISMRRAIHRKMEDLAKLNQIGSHLAAARDQQTALQEVLQSFSDKIGIEQGSVYLFNTQHELEAKAYLPPRAIPADSQPIHFTLGEGVLGLAAQRKETLFVPDTSKDQRYVQGETNDKPRALLCVPLLDKDMLIGVMNFSGDINQVNFADSDYEFVASAATSLVTTIKNIRMVEVIEAHNRDLEQKVTERTAALKQKNDDIANMLQNMNQGLFTITENGIVHSEYAKYLETILQTDHIAQRNFIDLLFEHATASQDIIDQVATSVESIVGEDTLIYEFNEHLLIPDLTLHFPGTEEKLIELDWNPIIDESDTVTKLMVTVRDVTALRALQAKADAQRDELSVIGEVLAVEAGKFDAFLAGSREFLARCRTLIEKTTSKNSDIIAELFRNMHTIKGNARTYGLKKITETVHLIENTYDHLRREPDSAWQPDVLLAELNDADQMIEYYATVFYEKLGRGADTHVVKLPRERVKRLVTHCQQLASNVLPTDLIPFLDETYTTLISADAKPVTDVLSGVLTSVASLANELGKPQPRIDIQNGGLLVQNDIHDLLNNIFMHVMRNAMDHGIESPEQRRAAGKAEQGLITLSTQETEDTVTFSVSDDGKGIALTRIYQKAIEQGLYTAEDPRPAASDIANLIFASGFSTAEQVTEVSGRGVGMDAVKAFLEAQGGSIEVVLAEGPEEADYRAFATVLRLPTRFFVRPLILARAS